MMWVVLVFFISLLIGVIGSLVIYNIFFMVVCRVLCFKLGVKVYINFLEKDGYGVSFLVILGGIVRNLVGKIY